MKPTKQIFSILILFLLVLTIASTTKALDSSKYLTSDQMLSVKIKSANFGEITLADYIVKGAEGAFITSQETASSPSAIVVVDATTSNFIRFTNSAETNIINAFMPLTGETNIDNAETAKYNLVTLESSLSTHSLSELNSQASIKSILDKYSAANKVQPTSASSSSASNSLSGYTTTDKQKQCIQILDSNLNNYKSLNVQLNPSADQVKFSDLYASSIDNSVASKANYEEATGYLQIAKLYHDCLNIIETTSDKTTGISDSENTLGIHLTSFTSKISSDGSVSFSIAAKILPSGKGKDYSWGLLLTDKEGNTMLAYPKGQNLQQLQDSEDGTRTVTGSITVSQMQIASNFNYASGLSKINLYLVNKKDYDFSTMPGSTTSISKEILLSSAITGGTKTTVYSGKTKSQAAFLETNRLQLASDIDPSDSNYVYQYKITKTNGEIILYPATRQPSDQIKSISIPFSTIKINSQSEVSSIDLLAYPSLSSLSDQLYSVKTYSSSSSTVTSTSCSSCNFGGKTCTQDMCKTIRMDCQWEAESILSFSGAFNGITSFVGLSDRNGLCSEPPVPKTGGPVPKTTEAQIKRIHDNWDSVIQQTAKDNNLDPYVIYGLIMQESKGNELAVSSTGCVGLGQICATTATDKNLPKLQQLLPTIKSCNGPSSCAKNQDTDSRYDPTKNIQALGVILAKKASYFPDYLAKTELAVAAYNAGEGSVRSKVSSIDTVKGKTWDEISKALGTFTNSGNGQDDVLLHVKKVMQYRDQAKTVLESTSTTSASSSTSSSQTGGNSVTGNAVLCNAVAIGDSITQAQGKIPYTTTLNNYCGVNIYANKGISGQNTIQISNRFTTDVTNGKYKDVVIFAGVNDLGLATNADASFNQVTGNLLKMYKAAKASGSRVIAVTITPWSGYTENGKLRSTPQALEATRRINQWIMSQTSSGTVDFVVDAYSALVTPGGLSMQTEYDSGDHIHPNQLGENTIANLIFQKVYNGDQSLCQALVCKTKVADNSIDGSQDQSTTGTTLDQSGDQTVTA